MRSAEGLQKSQGIGWESEIVSPSRAVGIIRLETGEAQGVETVSILQSYMQMSEE
jgi:hypothetical protein